MEKEIHFSQRHRETNSNNNSDSLSSFDLDRLEEVAIKLIDNIRKKTDVTINVHFHIQVISNVANSNLENVNINANKRRNEI